MRASLIDWKGMHAVTAAIVLDSGELELCSVHALVGRIIGAVEVKRSCCLFVRGEEF